MSPFLPNKSMSSYIKYQSTKWYNCKSLLTCSQCCSSRSYYHDPILGNHFRPSSLQTCMVLPNYWSKTSFCYACTFWPYYSLWVHQLSKVHCKQHRLSFVSFELASHSQVEICTHQQSSASYESIVLPWTLMMHYHQTHHTTHWDYCQWLT